MPSSLANTPLRIGIDARFLGLSQPGGFRTYTTGLIAGLAEIDHENDYFLYVGCGTDIAVPLPKNMQVCPLPERMPLLGMPYREQVDLVRRAKEARLDLFHAPVLTAPLHIHCPLVVTLHDMIWHRRVRWNIKKPSLKHYLLDLYYRHVPERAARRASAVITVSDASKKQILLDLNLPAERVAVISEAASAAFRRRTLQDCEQSLKKLTLSTGFVLAMGSADPRKNVAGLLEAYSGLSADMRKQHPLVVVWAHMHLAGIFRNLAESMQIQNDVVFLEGVSDDDLVSIYSSADLFAFVSHSEGFGLPVLEAMACGCPVITANNSSLPEIAGDAAIFVSSTDSQALTDALRRVLSDKDLRQTLVASGERRAAAFTWSRCAKETLAVYRRVAGAV